MAMQLAHRGQLAPALEMDLRALRSLEEMEDEWGWQHVSANLLYHYVLDNNHRAVEKLRISLEQRLASGVPGVWKFDVLDTLLVYSLKVGDLEDAAVIRDKLRRAALQQENCIQQGWLRLREAMWMRHAGDSRGSIATLERSLQSKLKDALLIALTQFELASGAAVIREVALASRSADIAFRMFRKLGFTRDEIRRRRQLLTSMAVQPTRPTRTGGAFNEYIGASQSISNVRKLCRRVAKSECIVVLLGESGTGKSALARLIHVSSTKAARPYVKFDCTCNDEGMVESLLFGHVRGAFTGAVGVRVGLVDVASGGTLFIDEIGDLPLAMQSKLLALLEEGTFRPVGGHAEKRVQVRFIVATNRNLEADVAEGRFREDLFYRLGTFMITLPPLREHTEDIPQLVEKFLGELNARHGQGKLLMRGVLARLQEYDWPGNVRQLSRALERAYLLSDGREISLAAFSIHGLEKCSQVIRTLDEVEGDHIRRVLEIAGGNKSRAARLLGMKRTTLYSRMQTLGLH